MKNNSSYSLHQTVSACHHMFCSLLFSQILKLFEFLAEEKEKINTEGINLLLKFNKMFFSILLDVMFDGVSLNSSSGSSCPWLILS